MTVVIQPTLPGLEGLMSIACSKPVMVTERVNLFGKWIEDVTFRPCLREMGHIGRHDPVPRKTATSVDKS